MQLGDMGIWNNIRRLVLLKKILNFLFIDSSLKNDIGFLKNVSLFQYLSDRELARIALIIFKKDYLEGEVIFEPHQESEIVYIVHKGQIKLSNEQIIEEGMATEESCLVIAKKHILSAKALKSSRLYLIYKVRLNDLMDLYPKMGLKIMKNLNKSLLENFCGSKK
jgi:CRP/FNR family transcriptional regulator